MQRIQINATLAKKIAKIDTTNNAFTATGLDEEELEVEVEGEGEGDIGVAVIGYEMTSPEVE